MTMLSVELVRLENSYTYGAFGVVKINKGIFCCSLEEDSFGNLRNISCIPTGQYICERINSPKHGETYLVKNVPGRSGILFHPGNTIDDTEGCILLGSHWEKFNGSRMVLNSGKTFKKFMETAKGNRFVLTVSECF